MLDIDYIRENSEVAKEGARKKRRDPLVVDKVLELDKSRRGLLQKVEELRAERNRISESKSQRVKESVND